MEKNRPSQNIVLIMTAGFWYMFCSMSTAPIIAGYAESAGASSLSMGIISALITVSAMVCRPITGNLVDRINRLYMVLTGCLLMIAACAGYILFPVVWCIAVFRVLHGIGYACCSIAMSTWITLLLPPEKMKSGVGLYGTINALAMAVAPAVSIRIKNYLGYQWSFLLAAVSALICIILVIFISDRCPVSRQEEKRERFSLRKLAAPHVIPIALLLAIISIPYTANKAFLVSYVEKAGLQMQPDLFFTFYAVILVLLRVLLRRSYDRIEYPRFVVFCSISMLFSMACLFFMRGYMPLLLGAVFMAAGYGVMYSVSQSAAAAAVPAGQRGLAMATYYLGLDMGSALGPFVGGILYGAPDIRLFYPLLALFAAASLLLGFLFGQGRRKDARPEISADTKKLMK